MRLPLNKLTTLGIDNKKATFIKVKHDSVIFETKTESHIIIKGMDNNSSYVTNSELLGYTTRFKNDVKKDCISDVKIGSNVSEELYNDNDKIIKSYDNTKLLMSIDSSELQIALTNAMISAPKSDVRYYLNGVCINIKDKHIVATDGRRITRSVVPMDVHGEGVNVLIKYEDVKYLLQLLKLSVKTRKVINFSLYNDTHEVNNLLKIDCVDFAILTKPNRGNYPDYNRVYTNYDQYNSFKQRFNTKRLQGYLNTFTKIAKSNCKTAGYNYIDPVRFTFKDDTCTLSIKNKTSNAEFEEVTFKLEDHVDEEITFLINSKFLMDSLKTIVNQGFTLEVAPDKFSVYTYEYLEHSSPKLVNKIMCCLDK